MVAPAIGDVGAWFADGVGDAEASAGDSYVVFGKAGGFAAAINLARVAAGQGGFVIHGQNARDYSGRSAASAGDGAPYADGTGNAERFAGDSYVLFGGAFAPGPAGTAGDDHLVGGGQSADGVEGLAGDGLAEFVIDLVTTETAAAGCFLL